MKNLFYKGIFIGILYIIIVNFAVNFLNFCVAKLIENFIALYITTSIVYIIMVFLFLKYHNYIEKNKIVEKKVLVYLIPPVVLLLGGILKRYITNMCYLFGDFNVDNFMNFDAFRGYIQMIFYVVIIIFFARKHKKQTTQ